MIILLLHHSPCSYCFIVCHIDEIKYVLVVNYDFNHQELRINVVIDGSNLVYVTHIFHSNYFIYCFMCSFVNVIVLTSALLVLPSTTFEFPIVLTNIIYILLSYSRLYTRFYRGVPNELNLFN